MGTTSNDALGRDIEKIRGELKQLRDDIRVRLHLGAMDARDAFGTIEHELDHAGREVSQATLKALVRGRKQLQQIAAAFRSPDAHGKSG